MPKLTAKSDNDKSEYNVTVRINDNGRIVIPAEFRKHLGLKPGDAVVLSMKGSVLQIESHEARIRQVQEEFRKFAKPGVSASGELMAERREEAAGEIEEWLG